MTTSHKEQQEPAVESTTTTTTVVLCVMFCDRLKEKILALELLVRQYFMTLPQRNLFFFLLLALMLYSLRARAGNYHLRSRLMSSNVCAENMLLSLMLCCLLLLVAGEKCEVFFALTTLVECLWDKFLFFSNWIPIELCSNDAAWACSKVSKNKLSHLTLSEFTSELEL